MADEYDKQKDIEAEGQRAAIFYHQMPKAGVCNHDWPGGA